MNEPNGGLPATLPECLSWIKTAIDALSWVDASYGRAYDFERENAGGKPYLTPRSYAADGEYADCRPDDDRRSVVFFRAKGPEKPDFDRSKHSPPHRVRGDRELSLYGWVNLARFEDKTPDWTEEIKISLYQKLKYLPTVKTIDNFNDGRFSDVFSPYTFDQDVDWKKYDRYPYVCFRLDFTVMILEPKPTTI